MGVSVPSRPTRASRWLHGAAPAFRALQVLRRMTAEARGNQEQVFSRRERWCRAPKGCQVPTHRIRGSVCRGAGAPLRPVDMQAAAATTCVGAGGERLPRCLAAQADGTRGGLSAVGETRRPVGFARLSHAAPKWCRADCRKCTDSNGIIVSIAVGLSLPPASSFGRVWSTAISFGGPLQTSAVLTLAVAGWGAVLSTYVAVRQIRRERQTLIAKIAPQGTGFWQFRVGNVGQEPTVVVEMRLRFGGPGRGYSQDVRSEPDSHGRSALPHVPALAPHQYHLPLTLAPGDVVEFLSWRSGPRDEDHEIRFRALSGTPDAPEAVERLDLSRPAYDTVAVRFIDHLDRPASARYPGRFRRRRRLPSLRRSGLVTRSR